VEKRIFRIVPFKCAFYKISMWQLSQLFCGSQRPRKKSENFSFFPLTGSNRGGYNATPFSGVLQKRNAAEDAKAP